MKKFKNFTGLSISLLIFSVGGIFPLQAAQAAPKLVLLLVIDQFRADYLTRFASKFMAADGNDGHVGGFTYLKSHSAYFPQGQYLALNSVTAAGHATILTGASPYLTGVPLNDWWDAVTQKETYCTEDLPSKLIGTSGALAYPGRSPKNLGGATTIGDELKLAGFPSRVISIALKDRAAILMGGHNPDLALWYHSSENQWVSSQYYLPSGKLPDWVNSLNQPTQGSAPDIASPYGLEKTVIAAEKAIENYHLGNGKATDLLAVSFSSHDMVGHTYGPNSPQMEEMTLAEDRLISRLLNHVRSHVPGGLKGVVIVLTGDHGVSPSPNWARDHQLDAGPISGKDLLAKINAHLDDKWGKPAQGSWAVYQSSFHFYLNQPLIREKKLNRAEVEQEAKSILLQDPHTAYVMTASEYTQGKFPPGIFEQQARHSFYPGRSGDLILIPQPFYMPKQRDANGTNHNSGYSYDRTVPILLSGAGIKPGIYPNHAEVIDIAPTLAFLLGIVPPSLSEGRTLVEALEVLKSK